MEDFIHLAKINNVLKERSENSVKYPEGGKPPQGKTR
jgi:hypothetical protein